MLTGVQHNSISHDVRIVYQ